MAWQSVHRDAPQDAPRRPIRSHACSSARSAVPSAYVCLLEPTETKSPVLVTITGRPRGVDPNAPEQLITFSKIVSCYRNLQLVCAHVKW
uniref:Uncharacterized protein n=1 Tax=Rhizophora mucronata TaxID=61149 RepID=A0A2P2JTB8_RHIMU